MCGGGVVVIGIVLACTIVLLAGTILLSILFVAYLLVTMLVSTSVLVTVMAATMFVVLIVVWGTIVVNSITEHRGCGVTF